MTYQDMYLMERGHMVDHKRVLWVHRMRGGGAGMGEYPASVTVVLEDGRVLNADEWAPKARLMHGPIDHD